MKQWVCSRWLARIAVSNPTVRGGGGKGMSFVSAIFGQPEVPATRRSLVQRSPIGYFGSNCGIETSARRRS